MTREELHENISILLMFSPDAQLKMEQIMKFIDKYTDDWRGKYLESEVKTLKLQGIIEGLQMQLKQKEENIAHCAKNHDWPAWNRFFNEATERIEKLEAELKEYKDDQKAVMAETCGKERHCTCVPTLKALLKKAEARIKELENADKT